MAAATLGRSIKRHALSFQGLRLKNFPFPTESVPLMLVMAADRRLSYNGLKSFNGYGTKTPFLIGVAGGTASGKVFKQICTC